jgi:hypothetical protein
LDEGEERVAVMLKQRLHACNTRGNMRGNARAACKKSLQGG